MAVQFTISFLLEVFYFQILLHQGCRFTDHLNWSGGATACVTTCRLAEADPSLKILVRFKRKFGFFSIFLILIPQIVEAGPDTRDEPNHIYSQVAILAASFVLQIHLRFIWQNLVLLFVIVQWLFLQDGPLAVDRV